MHAHMLFVSLPHNSAALISAGVHTHTHAPTHAPTCVLKILSKALRVSIKNNYTHGRARIVHQEIEVNGEGKLAGPWGNFRRSQPETASAWCS